MIFSDKCIFIREKISGANTVTLDECNSLHEQVQINDNTMTWMHDIIDIRQIIYIESHSEENVCNKREKWHKCVNKANGGKKCDR